MTLRIQYLVVTFATLTLVGCKNYEDQRSKHATDRSGSGPSVFTGDQTAETQQTNTENTTESTTAETVTENSTQEIALVETLKSFMQSEGLDSLTDALNTLLDRFRSEDAEDESGEETADAGDDAAADDDNAAEEDADENTDASEDTADADEDTATDNQDEADQAAEDEDLKIVDLFERVAERLGISTLSGLKELIESNGSSSERAELIVKAFDQDEDGKLSSAELKDVVSLLMAGAEVYQSIGNQNANKLHEHMLSMIEKRFKAQSTPQKRIAVRVNNVNQAIKILEAVLKMESFQSIHVIVRSHADEIESTKEKMDVSFAKILSDYYRGNCLASNSDDSAEATDAKLKRCENIVRTTGMCLAKFPNTFSLSKLTAVPLSEIFCKNLLSEVTVMNN